MSHLVMLLLTLSLISTILIGCSNSSNPVTPSETQTSGALQYTFATPKTTYNPGDTLTAAVTVHNPGFSTDTIAVGDGIFEWALVTSSGDTVMIGGGASWSRYCLANPKKSTLSTGYFQKAQDRRFHRVHIPSKPPYVPCPFF
jgi:ABC-type transport system substrate-binding protein